MVEFGVSVLKGNSGNKHTAHFVLYKDGDDDLDYYDDYDDDYQPIDHHLSSIIDRLPTDGQRQFIIDEYTDKDGLTYPCISRSASGESTDSIVVVYSICVGELCGGSYVGGNPNAPCPLWASRVYS